MERSFSHLLRTSRLATFDKTIPQIYTTSGRAKAIGDWGLKRNLPTVVRTHVLNIEQLDTAEHQTPFQSASSDYLFLQRWKENFPRSRPPQPQPVTVKKDLSNMTDKEFKKLLEAAKEKRQAWKEALSKNEARPDDHLDFMNVTSTVPKVTGIDTNTSQASVGASGFPTAPPFTAPKASTTRIKVGPTYGFYEPSNPTIVQGRSLGRGRSSQLVGVCGVVASLPTYSSPNLLNISKSLQPFYVYKSELDAEGRPTVVLGHTPPPVGHWLTGSGSSRFRRLPQGAASATNPDNKTSTQANDGRKVVTRVQTLLELHDKSPTRV
ncbi:hypothetical protein EDD11_002921 [Mortierella claussenii]|nr:hypothetical protein EDD11_002921 [Mortierella claussenii]